MLGDCSSSIAFAHFFDPPDISVWVLGKLFARAAQGRAHFTDSAQFGRYLRAMARNQVLDEARRFKAECGQRDRDSLQLARGLEQAAGKEEEPSALASRCEALELIRACLSNGDWEVLVSRASGESWQDIAERLGSTPDALRMHFQRVIRELEGIIVSL